MAGVLKVRDGGGTLRTITALKVRDGGGTLRTITSAKIRDASGTLREFFNSGGGGGGGNPVSISPGYVSKSGKPSTGFASFTASSSGTAPTSYAWGVITGAGYISGPTNQATAQLNVMAEPQSTEQVLFYCDVVVAGISYRATCQFDYYCTLNG